MDADVVVLSVAIYNFNLPGSLKAWIDQVIQISRQRIPQIAIRGI